MKTAVFPFVQNSPLSSDGLTALVIAGRKLSKALFNNDVVKMCSSHDLFRIFIIVSLRSCSLIVENCLVMVHPLLMVDKLQSC